MSCNYTVLLALSHKSYVLLVNGLKLTFPFSLFLQQLMLQPEIYPEGAKPVCKVIVYIMTANYKKCLLKTKLFDCLSVLLKANIPYLLQSNERRYSLMRVCISFSILRCIIKLCIVTLRLFKSFESLFSCG